MPLKTTLINCCCLMALLAGCASVNSMDNNTAGDSMLVIGAQLRSMNADWVVDNTERAVSAVSVKNLGTSQVYSMELNSGHAIARLPAGTYCVNSVTPKDSRALVYCSQPYFTLTPHKIVVTGYFIFALDKIDNSYMLSDSFVDKQGLFNSLSKAEIKSLEDFDGTKD